MSKKCLKYKYHEKIYKQTFVLSYNGKEYICILELWDRYLKTKVHTLYKKTVYKYMLNIRETYAWESEGLDIKECGKYSRQIQSKQGFN